MAIHIKGMNDLKSKLKEADEKLVVIDFMTTWWEPCNMIEPKFDQLAENHKDKIVFLKVDLDENEEILQEYRIQNTPTFFFLKKNRLVEKLNGANDEQLEAAVNKHK